MVNGGVIAMCEGARVFIPASHADERYLGKDGVLVIEVPIRIIDINKKRRKLWVLLKLYQWKGRKTEEFWAKIEVGKMNLFMTVKTLTKFGAL